ncbi:hypothetical protein [Chryseobacterium gossypii]|uniref:hypothetical protein n=1 Tax=Chryseobacterium gossypii TaxID=3231602 RepID=UPI003523CF5E
MIAIRPVLPLVNYVVNYDYIAKNLCENRNNPESTCKGKCYVKKELVKTEKESGSSQTVKCSSIDVFLYNEIFTYTAKEEIGFLLKDPVSWHSDFHTSEHFSRIFHPPLV